MSKFDAQNLAKAAWAFAAMNQADVHLLVPLARAVEQSLVVFETRNLFMTFAVACCIRAVFGTLAATGCIEHLLGHLQLLAALEHSCRALTWDTCSAS